MCTVSSHTQSALEQHLLPGEAKIAQPEVRSSHVSRGHTICPGVPCPGVAPAARRDRSSEAGSRALPSQRAMPATPGRHTHSLPAVSAAQQRSEMPRSQLHSPQEGTLEAPVRSEEWRAIGLALLSLRLLIICIHSLRRIIVIGVKLFATITAKGHSHHHCMSVVFCSGSTVHQSMAECTGAHATA